MAVTAKVLGKRKRVGLLQRAKSGDGHWAAANDSTTSSNFRELHWLDVGSPIVDDGVSSENLNVISANGIHIESERRFHEQYSSLIRVPFSGIADKSTLSMFLCSAMQVCTEDAGTPYKKVFTSIGLTSCPNFAQNEGYLFDMAILNPASADDGILLKRGIIDNLQINVNFRGKGQARLFKISGTFVFNSVAYRQTFTTTGWTNTTEGQNFLNKSDAWVMVDGTVTYEMEIGGAAYSSEYLHDFVLNINNNVEGDNFGTSGVAGQYIIKPQYSGTINFWYTSVTEALIDATQQNDTAKIYLTNDSALAYTDGKLHIYSATGYVTKSQEVEDGDYMKMQIQFMLQSTAAATPLTITYTDTVDYGF